MLELINLLSYNDIDYQFEEIQGSAFICFKYMNKRIKVSRKKLILLEPCTYINVYFNHYEAEYDEVNNYIEFFTEKDETESSIYITFKNTANKKGCKLC